MGCMFGAHASPPLPLLPHPCLPLLALPHTPQPRPPLQMASRDFLFSPSLMPLCYHEWAHACHQLSESGLLSAGAKAQVQDLSEALELAPAGCLEFFDTVYKKYTMQHGELNGFPISGRAPCRLSMRARSARVAQTMRVLAWTASLSSGHPLFLLRAAADILRAVTVRDKANSALPLSCNRPLQGIRSALKYESKLFLGQGVIHQYLRCALD